MEKCTPETQNMTSICNSPMNRIDSWTAATHLPDSDTTGPEMSPNTKNFISQNTSESLTSQEIDSQYNSHYS